MSIQAQPRGFLLSHLAGVMVARPRAVEGGMLKSEWRETGRSFLSSRVIYSVLPLTDVTDVVSSTKTHKRTFRRLNELFSLP